MPDLTTETLEAIKSLNFPGNIAKAAATVSTSTGLVAYDLQAPAKNLYPVNTPLRNSIPRKGGTGTATNWKQITGITGSGFDAMGWVAEGQRAGAMSLTEQDKNAAYRTIGEEESINWEAISAAQGFEDIKSTMVMRLLQKMMLKEEKGIIGGNQSLSLGTTNTPTLTQTTVAGATLPTLTYSVIAVAMTYEGYKNYTNSIVTGLLQSKTITGQDNNTFILNGGYAQKSVAATQAITLGQQLNCIVPVTTGAVAYAWYVGAAGSERLEKVTAINSAIFALPLAGTGQLASVLTATDNSKNASLAYDGLLTTAYSNVGTAYVNSLASGVAGTGTVLTASGHGSVVEIDAMFKAMWDNYQISPDCLYVHSQELTNITTKALSGASAAPLVRFNMDNSNPNSQRYVAGQVIGFYFNPYTSNGGMAIPIRLHPDLVPGTLFGYAENLPEQYKSNNVPNVAEIKARRDYYQVDFPQVTRQAMTGVYSEQVLTVYAPFALGIITNIANG